MIVVSDTTPIISLIKINRLELLHQLFGEIQIPNAVYMELTSNVRFKEEAELVFKAEYLRKVIVEDAKSVELLRRVTGLDAGESEAIILSDISNAKLLLMDEVKGRQVARQMGLNIMGTIGVLTTAYEERLLSANEIKQCIEILQQSGRHVSRKLYEQLMYKIVQAKF